jgi:hypothetical protein
MTTNVVYPADGTNDLFAVPFPYLEKAHVFVFLNGSVLPSTAYTWETASSIRFVTAPAAGSNVGIYRQTPEDPLTIYQAGSTVTTEELETDSLQALYRIEEIANGTLGGVYDSEGNFVWDAQGHRIINVGDPVLEQDAVNRRYMLEAVGNIVSLGLNTSPQMWELEPDGIETQFFIPGADVSEDVFYDVFVDGVAIEPTDGFGVTISTDPSGSYITFVVPPASGAQVWVILRGFAMPVGTDLFNNQDFLDLLLQIITNTFFESTTVLKLGAIRYLIPLYDITGTAETVDGSKESYLLRTTNAAPVTVTVRANTGSETQDWATNPVAAPFFSVKQSGTGQVELVGEAGVTLTPPIGYLAKTRVQNSVITATGDYIAGGAWTLSGDLALDPAYVGGGGGGGFSGSYNDLTDKPTLGTAAAEDSAAFATAAQGATADTAVQPEDLLKTPNVQTASYVAALTDEVVEMDSASANTFTVPPNSSVAFPIGSILEVWQAGAGQTTIVAGAGVTIKPGASNTLALLEQDAGCSIRKTGTDTWRLIGKMEAA